MNQIIHRF